MIFDPCRTLVTNRGISGPRAHWMRVSSSFRRKPTGRTWGMPLIDISGPAHASSRRYRNLQANPVLAFVVDDMTPDEPGEIKPGMGRGVEIRGRAELTRVEVPPVAPHWFSNDVIRIHPQRILSWHIDAANPDGYSRTVTSAEPDG